MGAGDAAPEDSYDTTLALPDRVEELLDYFVRLTLTQQSSLPLLKFVALSQLEPGHRNGAVLTIALDLVVPHEALPEHVQRQLNHVAVLAVACLAEGPGDCVQALRRVLDAIDQVVSVLAFEALVERYRLQACEAHQVGVPDLFRCHTVAVEELGLDLGNFV